MMVFAAAALIALGSTAIGVASTVPPTTKVSINLPDDLGNHFKPGPGSELATNNCILCHSSAYVSTQPPLTLKQWTGEVTKMRKVYGATFISDADAATIAQYLTTTYGIPSPPAPKE